MRTLALALPVCAALAAACDRSPTAPAKTSAKPENLIIGLTGGSPWTLVDLPFAPTAINDAGIVVGSLNGVAVEWQNGTLTALPPLDGVPGPYAALGITPDGKIFGRANGHALYWLVPTAEPFDVSTDPSLGFVPFTPKAMNDAFMIVGYTSAPPLSNGTVQAVQWTPTGGFKNISRYNFEPTYALSLNASGYAAGYEAVSCTGKPAPYRWSPSGVPTRLPQPLFGTYCTGAVAVSINNIGDVAGSTVNGATVWHLDGTISVIAGLSNPFQLSNAGRIIGNDSSTVQPWTYYGGSVTWLTTPASMPPKLVGVNTCGSIVGVRRDLADAGYLWIHGGLRPMCDGSTTILSRGHARDAGNR